MQDFSLLNNLRQKISFRLPLLIFIIFGCIYFIIVICNHYFFRTYAFDYGAYNFAFYDYAHFRIGDCPIYHIPHMSFLQDHVSFTLILFIPLYWIFSWFIGTYTLLLIQILIILYGAWALYKLIGLKTNNKLLAILALMQYFVLIGRWTSFFSDCNFAIMASSMVPVFLYYFEKRKLWPAALVFVFILLTREDMSLWTAFIGLFLLISHFRDRKLKIAALAVIVLSVGYFVFVFKVVIPLLETPYKEFLLFNYSVLGENPSEALVFILKHPFKTIKFLFINFSGNPAYNDLKPEFYIYYTLCGGFLLFYRPKYLLLFIPVLAKKMLNDDPIRWSTELYYSIEFVSILPVAVFLIISEIKNTTSRKIVISFVCLATFVLTIYEMESSHRKLNWWGDRKYTFYKSSFYKSDFNVKEVNKYLKIIPADAKVTASGTIVPHLAFRKKTYYFPRVDDAEYLVTFLKNDIYPLSSEQFESEIIKHLKSDEWNVIKFDYPLLILKREKNSNWNICIEIIEKMGNEK